MLDYTLEKPVTAPISMSRGRIIILGWRLLKLFIKTDDKANVETALTHSALPLCLAGTMCLPSILAHPLSR